MCIKIFVLHQYFKHVGGFSFLSFCWLSVNTMLIMRLCFHLCRSVCLSARLHTQTTKDHINFWSREGQNQSLSLTLQEGVCFNIFIHFPGNNARIDVKKNHVYLGSWYLRVLNAILVITILVSRSCSKCWNQQIIPFTLSHHISIGHADRNTIWNPHIHIFTQLNTRAATKWQTISPASKSITIIISHLYTHSTHCVFMSEALQTAHTQTQNNCGGQD